MIRGVVCVVLIAVVLQWLRQNVAGGQCESAARLEGKVALITGGTTGLGLESAVELATRGARVLLTARDYLRGQVAVDEVRRRSGSQLVESVSLDFNRLDTVRELASTLLANESRLDILMNNAGISYQNFSLTVDAMEANCQVNHLGHFLLTGLLMPLMMKSQSARIVHVSSRRHFHLSTISSAQQLCSRTELNSYPKTKLANVLFSSELAFRLKSVGIQKVTSNSVHPGLIDTNIQSHLPALVQTALKYLVFPFFSKTMTEGVQTQLCCAIDTSLEGVSGEYFSDCAVQLPSENSRNATLAAELWSLSEKLTNFKFVL